MKKAISVLLAIILTMIFLVSCSSNTAEAQQPSYFTTIYSCSIYDIIYDNNTKVMYSMSRGSYNQGTLSVLYDAEGNILTYGN